ncbi:unnamed protein product [Arctogadus glacialis]
MAVLLPARTERVPTTGGRVTVVSDDGEGRPSGSTKRTKKTQSPRGSPSKGHVTQEEEEEEEEEEPVRTLQTCVVVAMRKSCRGSAAGCLNTLIAAAFVMPGTYIRVRFFC